MIFYKLWGFIATIISWWESFGLEIMVLLQATGTFLVSNGNNIVSCNLTLFVANDVKGRQVALETDTRDNNNSWTRKPQVTKNIKLFIVPYTVADNGSK